MPDDEIIVLDPLDPEVIRDAAMAILDHCVLVAEACNQKRPKRRDILAATIALRECWRLNEPTIPG